MLMELGNRRKSCVLLLFNRPIHIVYLRLCRFGIAVCFFASRSRHTIFKCDWSSDVCSSDLRDAHRTGCATTPTRKAIVSGTANGTAAAGSRSNHLITLLGDHRMIPHPSRRHRSAIVLDRKSVV